MARVALALLHRFAINIHCCSDVGMAHQFLLYFHRSSSLVEKTPEGMAECVPTDMAYAATDGRGSYVPLLHSPRLPRQRACLERTREYPVVWLVELCRAVPVQKPFGQ
jgi:hypothetical protein